MQKLLYNEKKFVLGLCVLCLARWLSSELELQVDFVVNLVTNLSALLVSGASSPSEYIYIYIYIYSELNG